MRVLCPFTNLRPETSAALDASGYPWEAVSVKESDSAYWDLLSGLWAEREDFCLVEHDIIVGPGVLESFESCPEPWCVSPYPYMRASFAGLGCVRFRTALMMAMPRLWEDVAAQSNDLHPPKHWCTLDAWSMMRLQGQRFTQHHHAPSEHLDSLRPTHMCVG